MITEISSTNLGLEHLTTYSIAVRARARARFFAVRAPTHAGNKRARTRNGASWQLGSPDASDDADDISP